MQPEFLQYVLRLVAAMALGGIIGIEREVKGKPAGMRTNMLMCLGTCLLMILTFEVLREHPGPMGDPTRIASHVMTGIGFIGAGTIIQSRFTVIGLTSAATLWFVAAIGLVVGTGGYFLAGATTVLAMFTLSVLDGLERRLVVKPRPHILHFHFPVGKPQMQLVKKIVLQNRIDVENITIDRADKMVVVHMEYSAADSKHKKVIESIGAIEDIEILIDY